MPDEKLIDYFIAHTDKRFDAIEEAVRQHSKFSWLVMGGFIGINTVISLAIAIGSVFVR